MCLSAVCFECNTLKSNDICVGLEESGSVVLASLVQILASGPRFTRIVPIGYFRRKSD